MGYNEMEAQASHGHLRDYPIVNHSITYSLVVLLSIVFLFYLTPLLPVAYAQNFSLQPYGPPDLATLVNAIASWIFKIAIPIGVIVILWAGITMLTSGGNPGKIEKAKKMLGYAIAGLVVIFIGRGFISLIKSILELRP